MYKGIMKIGAVALGLAFSTLAIASAQAQDDGEMMRHRMMHHEMMRHEMHHEMMRHMMHHEMRRDMHRHMMHRMMEEN